MFRVSAVDWAPGPSNKALTATLAVGVPAKVPASKPVCPIELTMSVNGGLVGNGPLTMLFPPQSDCGFPEYAAQAGEGNGMDVVEVMH